MIEKNKNIINFIAEYRKCKKKYDKLKLFLYTKMNCIIF